MWHQDPDMFRVFVFPAIVVNTRAGTSWANRMRYALAVPKYGSFAVLPIHPKLHSAGAFTGSKSDRKIVV